MIRKFISDPQFQGLRIIVVVAALSSFITLVYNSVLFSLQLSFVQNFLVPFVCTAFYFPFNNLTIRQRLKTGLKLSILIGSITGGAYLFIGQINFYFLGGRERAAELLGSPVFPLSLKGIWVGIQSQIFIWLMLVAMSGVAGVLAAVFVRRRK